MAAEEASPSLLELARARNRKPGPTCPLENILAAHEKRDQIAELFAATGTDKDIQYSTAESVLKDIGLTIKSDTISRHLRGRCACRRS